MRTGDAVELIRPAVNGRSGAWADLGAGSGTFTRALLEILGPGSRVFAIDRDPSKLAALRRSKAKETLRVTVIEADFARAFRLPDPGAQELDGMLFANSLHFVEDPAAILARLARWLRPMGRVVVVEYDHRGPNRWVPYPIPATRWAELAKAAGLSVPAIVARRPSAYTGTLYVATADRGREGRYSGAGTGNSTTFVEGTMLNLPPVIVDYLDAERQRDAERLSLCFAEDGVVHDEGRDRRGRDGIRQWKEEVDAKYRYVSEPLAASALEDTVTLRTRLTGDFPGSPIEVNQIFRLERGQIASLEIRS